jgi:hypothetical protein
MKVGSGGYSRPPALLYDDVGVKFMERVRDRSANFLVQIMTGVLESGGLNRTYPAATMRVPLGFVVGLANQTAECSFVAFDHGLECFCGCFPCFAGHTKESIKNPPRECKKHAHHDAKNHRSREKEIGRLWQ